jgi:hypothetical protein
MKGDVWSTGSFRRMSVISGTTADFISGLRECCTPAPLYFCKKAAAPSEPKRCVAGGCFGFLAGRFTSRQVVQVEFRPENADVQKGRARHPNDAVSFSLPQMLQVTTVVARCRC